MLAKPRILITSQGWYYLFVVLFIVGGAIMREVNMLVILSGMLFGPMLLQWRLTIAALKNLSVTRKFNNPTIAGVETRMEILVENHNWKFGSWFVQLSDRIRLVNQNGAGQTTEIRLLVPFVYAGSVARVPFTWDIARRGVYELGPFYVESRFPFGLIRARVNSREREQIVVCPQLGRLTPQWRRVIESDHLGLSGNFSRQGRSEGDYYAMRQWRSGDSTRWIHWRTTARLGELMVRQYEQQRDRAVGIVLDLWGDENGSDGDEHAVVVEIAVSMAATIVNDLCSRSGSYFNLTIAGEGVNHFSATPSQNVVREVLENLAVVHPGSGSSLVDSFDWLSHEGKQGMTVVIVSTRSRSQALEQLETMTGESQIATQQGWSLQDALWIDCQNAEDVRGYFQPFDVDLTETAETKRRSAEVQMTEARAAVGEAI